jgi:DNA-binding NarL/FixJ family response regulator
VAENSKQIRVMLAEDHLTLREGLRLLLEAEGDIKIVAEVESGHDAVQKGLEVRPDVVLMDVALIGLDGIEAVRQLLSRAPAPQPGVLMLSASAELYVTRAALEAGAIGYLLKKASGRELREAVRSAATGKPYFSDEVLRAVRERVGQGTVRRRATTEPRAYDSPGDVLTDRELEVLQMIAGGHSNREIAEILKLSVKTVETHRMHLMEKLDIHDVAGLVRYALRKGLIQV